MAFAECVRNICYLSAPQYILSRSKATDGGYIQRHVVYQSLHNRIQGSSSFEKLIPICGFLGHLCVLKIELQLLHKIYPRFCSSRCPVCYRGPQGIKVSPKLFGTLS